MSDLRFFEELGAELERVGRSRSGPRESAKRIGSKPRWGRLLGVGIRAAATLVAVAVAVVIAAAVLLSVRHRERSPHEPTLPVPAPGLSLPNSPVGSAAQRLIDRAWESTERSDRGCVPRPVPESSGATPSSSLLARLAVLRGHAGRPLSSVSHFFEDAGPQLGGGLYYEPYARIARIVTLRGGAVADVYVVPMGNAVGPLSPAPRCYRWQSVALQGALASATGSLRAPTLALDAREREDQRRPEGVGVMVSYSFYGSPEVGNVYRGTTVELARRGVTGTGFVWAGRFVLSGIVPDGVVTVTLRYPSHGKTASFTVSTRPVNNIFVIQIPRRFAGVRPVATVWRAASGQVIKTIAGEP